MENKAQRHEIKEIDWLIKDILKKRLCNHRRGCRTMTDTKFRVPWIELSRNLLKSIKPYF
jgi:hypothetical protein